MYQLKPMTFDWIRHSHHNGSVLQLERRWAPRLLRGGFCRKQCCNPSLILTDAAVGHRGAWECEDRRDGTEPLDIGRDNADASEWHDLPRLCLLFFACSWMCFLVKQPKKTQYRHEWSRFRWAPHMWQIHDLAWRETPQREKGVGGRVRKERTVSWVRKSSAAGHSSKI